MNDDQKLIAEAYKRIYLESDKEFRDEDLRADALEHEDKEAAQNELNDNSWAEKYIPWGLYQTKKFQVGVDDNKGEYALWYIPNDGEVTYDHYLVYKNEGKVHDISEEQYYHFSKLAASQR
jgi:hypothetical protein